MADPTPTPTPTEPYWWPTAKQLIVALVTAVISILVSRYGFPPAPVVQRVEVPVPPTWLAESGKPLIGIGDGEARPTHGWVRDADVIEANRDPAKTTQFSDTPAGKTVMGDEDTFLWRAVRKAGNFPDNVYPSIDQGKVGCCVGCGWKHAADVCLAFQVVSGRAEEWKPVSAEAIYALSRVEVGGGKIRGDGSNGSWAKDAVSLYGLLAMQSYPAADLSTFSSARARSWGQTGLPNALEATAKEHPVKGAALVKNWTDVKRSLQQGYPIAVCSDQGFTMQRDSTGTCHPSGTWNHCMSILGCRTLNGKEQGYILNNWGNNAHTGPCVPPDAPVAGFWADAQVISGMVSQGDSFALADAVGFPARRIPVDWFVQAPAKRPAAILAFAPALAY